jgi:hypothetical protein
MRPSWIDLFRSFPILSDFSKTEKMTKSGRNRKKAEECGKTGSAVCIFTACLFDLIKSSNAWA